MAKAADEAKAAVLLGAMRWTADSDVINHEGLHVYGSSPVTTIQELRDPDHDHHDSTQARN